MDLCIAGFLEDAAGALGLYSAAPIQYFRPEIDPAGCSDRGNGRIYAKFNGTIYKKEELAHGKIID